MLYGCKLPIWCYESQSLPAVYKKVLERSLALDGSIDTNKLYSLLLASNVSKDKLKDIWGMANKRTPGVLVQEELNIVLGLIALAQVGVNFGILTFVQLEFHAQSLIKATLNLSP